MLNLKNTSSILRAVIAAAANVTCHASWVDLAGSVVSADSNVLAPITTATTVTLVPAPGAATIRNVQALYITNKSPSASTRVTIEHFDGTNTAELMSFILLPGENMTFNEEGRWSHRDAQGAEYAPAGEGAFNGYPVSFMKTSTGADATGYWYCTSKDGGFPGAWAPGTPGLNGRVTDGTAVADAGCLPIRNATLGANFMTAMEMASSVNHTHNLFDVLWVNSGLVVTTVGNQAITTPTLPPRDANGTTNGEGCMIALLFTAAATNGATISNTTVSYTNSLGVAGRTATLVAIIGSQIPVGPVVGTLVWFNLQAGDTGVSSIQGISLGTSLATGAISLMITRDLATIGTTIPGVSSGKKFDRPGVRLYNGTCALHCILASATTVTFFAGEVSITEK